MGYLFGILETKTREPMKVGICLVQIGKERQLQRARHRKPPFAYPHE